MKKTALIILVSIVLISLAAPAVRAAENLPTTSELMKLIDKTATTETEGKDWTTPVKMVMIFAGLALLPSLMVMMTSFTRIIIVLSFIRRALTTQTIPPNIAIIGLALFLTLFTMAPTFEKINTEAIEPYISDQIQFEQAAKIASNHIRQFMLRQTREKDLALFVQISKNGTTGRSR